MAARRGAHRQRVPRPRPERAPSAHARGDQASSAARKPGSARAGRVRGPAESADLSIALATSLIAVQGSGTHDVETAYDRAWKTAERLGDATRLYPALWGLCFVPLGEWDKGLQALGMIPPQHRGIIFAPEIERIRGDLVLGRGESAEAKACFCRAIELAQRREERSFELRAATSLARLLHGRGKRDEARAILAPIYDWFTEGFDTQDLREARALLDALT